MHKLLGVNFKATNNVIIAIDFIGSISASAVIVSSLALVIIAKGLLPAFILIGIGQFDHIDGRCGLVLDLNLFDFVVFILVQLIAVRPLNRDRAALVWLVNDLELGIIIGCCLIVVITGICCRIQKWWIAIFLAGFFRLF